MALICQTASRIANGSRTWQAACNVDITGWNKANEFIIATYALSDSKNPNSGFKLQWRRAGGTFADVTANTEARWGTDTVLVDGGKVGSTAGCLTPVDDSVENEGDNIANVINIAQGQYCEIQWALGFGSGALNEQEYEIQLISIDWSNSAVCQTSITTLSAPPRGPSGNYGTFKYGDGTKYGGAAAGQPTLPRTWGIPTGAGYRSGVGRWN